MYRTNKIDMKTMLRSLNVKESKFYYFINGCYYNASEEYTDIGVLMSNKISERICSEFNWNNAERLTGLTDKNGIKLFEGDTGIEKGHKKFEIIFLDGSFGYWYDLRGCGKFGFSSDFEKTGTIHDK